MLSSAGVWCLAVAVCSLALGQGRRTTSSLPKIDRINHYEPLSYDTGPLSDKHDRIARNIIQEPQIRNLQIRFSAYGRDFHLAVRPSRSVFSSGVKFTINGQPTNSYDPATFYEGEIEGDAESHVSGHVINGVFSGVIRTPEATYHVEKAKKFFHDRKDVTFHSFIYREDDVDFPQQPSACGINGTVWDHMKELQASAVPINDRKTWKNRKHSGTVSNLFTKSRDKRAFTATGGTFCHMRVAVDDEFFSDIGGSDTTDTFAEVTTTFNLVQDIYRMTDFDGDGQQDSITPSIEQFDILTRGMPGYRFGAASISVNDFLDLWSQDDHTNFCLALLFTNRDFADGVLGLAWVAQPPGGNRGGVCEGRVQLSIGKRSLNTAIVTYTNFGNRQPRAVSVVTIAHELGHNFGSPHDPTSGSCAPGSNGGNFIMFSRATNGQQSNNNKFSTCSIDDIRAVLQSSKSNCFSTEAFCGNSIIEEMEECDQDRCCDNDTCTLLPGQPCSSQQQCCDNTCNVRPAGILCRDPTDCAESSFCNGSSGACPDSTPRSSGMLCNNGSNVCDANGNCVGSYCLQFTGLEECQCTDDKFGKERLCDVCCGYRGECMTTFDLVQIIGDNDLNGIRGLTLEPGRSCNNFEGYCSQKDEAGTSTCIVVDNEKTLDDLLDLLSIETFNDIVQWLTVYWWVAIIIIIGLLVLFILLQVTYRKRRPLKRRLSRARNSLRRNSTDGGDGGQGQVRSDGGGREGRERGGRRRRDQNRRQISPDDAVRRLAAFFPTAESGTVRDVIRQSSSESKAVRRMLDLGYPMKKIPIPHA